MGTRLKRARRALSLTALVAAAASAPLACVDVGDSTAIPSHDAGGKTDGALRVEAGADADLDAPRAADGGKDVYAASDAIEAIGDTRLPDVAADTIQPRDSAADAADVSRPDATSDASLDAPAESGEGGSVTTCTTAGQLGCVPCAGSTDGLCTPTETLFLQRDIAMGLATVDAGDSSYGCYTCLWTSGCLDDSVYGDTGNECGDLVGAFDGGAPRASLCLATATCILGSSCVDTAGVSTCYCGTAFEGSACASAGSAVNGSCLTQEVDGLGFPASDNTDILKNYTSKALPSGAANELFQCAQSNGCSACLP